MFTPRWCFALARLSVFTMHFLYDSTPAEFRSAYGIAESVERLGAATKRSVFSALGETTAVGKVSEKVVRLQRVIPMVGNSFKLFFIGHFEVRGEVTVLIGKFAMLPLVKVFMSFWFGICGLFAGAVSAPIFGRAWCKQEKAVHLRNWAIGISSMQSSLLRCRLAYGADGRGRGGVVFCYWDCRFAGRCSPCRRVSTSGRPWGSR